MGVDSSDRLVVHFVTAGVLAVIFSLDPAHGSSPVPVSEIESERKVDFDQDIYPILNRRCFSCHGVRHQRGGLRLDHRASTVKGGNSGLAIVAGDSEASLLIQLVRGRDDGKVMPPNGDRLSEDEIALLRSWIDQGASWSATASDPGSNVAFSDHWSFQSVQRPEVPKVSQNNWVSNAVDAFVLHELEQKGLQPAEEAPRSVLLRRLSLDLLGLLPTPEQRDHFVKDTRPDAYERLVDRMLSSPHFGERWGRHWLDLARYADSEGYESDQPRPYAWRWRNWVIQAFNEDMPFDQFTINQLAGDLLPDATLDQKVATGFHRNTLRNREGGVDQEEDRVKIAVDRVNTTGTVWMGLTVGCSQCHDHKYDPLTHREYYELFAFFNTVQDIDIAAPLPQELELYQDAIADYEKQHQQLLAEMSEDASGNLIHRQLSWQTRVSEYEKPGDRWHVLKPRSFTSDGGAELTRKDDDSILAMDGPRPDKDRYRLVFHTELNPVTAVRLDFLTDPSLPKKGPGRADDGHFVINEIRLAASPAGDATSFKPVVLQNPFSNTEQQGFELKNMVDSDSKTGWDAGTEGTDLFVLLETSEDVGFDSGATLVLEIDQYQGDGAAVGRLRVSVATTDRSHLQDLPTAEVAEVLTLADKERTSDQLEQLMHYYRKRDSQWITLNRKVQDHEKEKPPYPKTLAQTLSRSEKKRETHLHVRGDFLRKGRTVNAATPAVLPPLSVSADSPSRLDLARWLMDPQHPLTARVAVNRIWQNLFGHGLVATPEDFGVRGELPSHPHLLDWLASEYVSRHWSRKAMIKMIALSSTYRQASEIRESILERDPKNRLLARQNRYRLESEVVRDLYLSASGLLHSTVGGPSIRPPLPADVAALGYANSVKWNASSAPEKYRRGLYIFYQRTVPYPMLATFDGPDAYVTCTRRERSNTPLQALTLLNDPVFVECAQALGKRVVEQSGPSPSERIHHVVRVCLGRDPDVIERTHLMTLYNRLKESAELDRDSVEKLIGDYEPEKTPVIEAAVWVAMARALLNLDEFVTRE